MDKSKIKCNICKGGITEYFSEKYKGNRGKCTQCEIDFPLE